MNRRLQSRPCIVLVATFRNGDPVRPRPELSETLPYHADMLRYDLGFHAPDDSSLVIFPWFKHKTNGAYPSNLTIARWRSFGLKLHEMNEGSAVDFVAFHPIDNWIGYRHNSANYSLVPVTLGDWIELNSKVIVMGWRGRAETAEAAGRYWAVTG